jgi:hypothetical protein
MNYLLNHRDFIKPDVRRINDPEALQEALNGNLLLNSAASRTMPAEIQPISAQLTGAGQAWLHQQPTWYKRSGTPSL